MCQLAANPKSSGAEALSDSGEPVRLRGLPSAFFFCYIYQPSDLCFPLALSAPHM